MRGRDPRIAKLALKVIRQSGAKPREYEKQAAALLKWVQDPKNCYYINEPGERLQDPIYTIKVKHGDCFPVGTLVLRDDYELVPIEQVKKGDRIWGKDRWSVVENQWFTGEKQITRIRLNNGSVVTLTDDHKVWVKTCAAHGPGCTSRNCRYGPNKDTYYGKGNLKSRGAEGVPRWTLTRLRVRELKPGMQLVQPDSIPGVERESTQGDVAEAHLEGLYVADGWRRGRQVYIAGRDGKPKEEQKRRVEVLCSELGIETEWKEKWIVLRAAELAERFSACGKGVATKQVSTLARTQEEARALFDGLLADASKNTFGAGWTSTP
jgi:hypothetical protein